MRMHIELAMCISLCIFLRKFATRVVSINMNVWKEALGLVRDSAINAYDYGNGYKSSLRRQKAV